MIIQNLFIVTIVTFISCMLSYLFDYTNRGYNEYISVLSTIGIMYLFLTFIFTAVSIYASYNQCEEYKKSVSLLKGIKMAFFNIIPVIIIIIVHMYNTPYLSSIFLTPFYKIFGEKYTNHRIVLYIIISFWSILSGWLITTKLYYESRIDGCKLDNNQLQQFKKSQQKKLNQKHEYKKEKKVTIHN